MTTPTTTTTTTATTTAELALPVLLASAATNGRIVAEAPQEGASC